MEHRERIIKQKRKDKSWGVKGKDLGDYWYEVVLEDVLKKHSKKVTEIMKRSVKQIERSSVEERIKALESEVESLRRELAKLREEHEKLKERFEELTLLVLKKLA